MVVCVVFYLVKDLSKLRKLIETVQAINNMITKIMFCDTRVQLLIKLWRNGLQTRVQLLIMLMLWRNGLQTRRRMHRSGSWTENGRKSWNFMSQVSVIVCGENKFHTQTYHSKQKQKHAHISNIRNRKEFKMFKKIVGFFFFYYLYDRQTDRWIDFYPYL